ncbi:heme exporter protein CcmB [Maricaulis sp. CAU 1757]
MSAAMAVFAREVRLAWAGGGGAAGPAAFFIAALTLAPLAIGPDPVVLAAAAPGLMGFAALLSVLQSAERLFGEDYSDGTLELYALAPGGLVLTSLAKVAGQAVATLWPLPLIGMVGGLMYGLPMLPALLLGLALLAATPALALIAGFAGALAAGVKRAGLLIALLAAPMMVPVLIFAAGAGRAAFEGDERALANLLLTCAASLATLALAPFGIAAAIRSRLG